MRLNQADFFESEETGLQICVLSGVQAIIMNSRGTGKFRVTPNYADEIENGEILCPQNTSRPPFNDPTIAFSNSSEIEEYLKSIEPMNESLKSTGTKKLNKKATTQWDKAAKSYKNYINYIDKKADRFELTLIDLLYISNFKGGNATINEAELELKNKLIAYSTELRTLDSKFGTRKLTNLNDDELNELIEKVHSICSLTRKTNVNKIDGFSISYLSALLNVYFPNLLPILDRRVLINFDIVTNGDINKQGQIIDIERFYDKLIIKMRDKARLENKSIRQIDKELFIIEIPKEKTDSENED